jgi:hypothetical protein
LDNFGVKDKNITMGRWSNSRNGNLRYSVNRENNSGIYVGPTQGLSSPKNNRRGCLCLNSNTYDRRCCNGALMEQGIGVIEAAQALVTYGAFSDGFSNGFDIT